MSFEVAAVGVSPVHRFIDHVTVLLETHHVDFGKNFLGLFSNDLGISAWSKRGICVSSVDVSQKRKPCLALSKYLL